MKNEGTTLVLPLGCLRVLSGVFILNILQQKFNWIHFTSSSALWRYSHVSRHVTYVYHNRLVNASSVVSEMSETSWVRASSCGDKSEIFHCAVKATNVQNPETKSHNEFQLRVWLLINGSLGLEWRDWHNEGKSTGCALGHNLSHPTVSCSKKLHNQCCCDRFDTSSGLQLYSRLTPTVHLQSTYFEWDLWLSNNCQSIFYPASVTVVSSRKAVDLSHELVRGISSLCNSSTNNI